jgi:hypothetical protein
MVFTKKHRALYSIAATGFTLTSFGCGGEEPPPPVDPIIADLDTIAVLGIIVPYSDTYTDANGETFVSSYDASDITIGADFKTTINITYQYTDTDANGTVIDSQDLSYDFDGDVTTVTLGSKYTINLVNRVDATDTFVLDCDLVGNIDLNCLDGGGDAWNFKIK